MTALKIILIISGALLIYQVLSRIVKKIYHVPAPAFIGRFLDSDFRRWLQPAEKMVARSGIAPGMTVLELGCGSGAFTPLIARAVGKAGKVYAVDIQPAMLRQLERKLSKAENRDLTNIELKQSGAYELPFADASLDLVCLVTVLPEISDRGRALREIKRVLKEDGFLAVTELLVDPDYVLRSTTIRLCQQEEFVLDGGFGNLWNYTVRFRKACRGQ